MAPSSMAAETCDRALNPPQFVGADFSQFVVSPRLPGGRAARSSPMLVPLAGLGHAQISDCGCGGVDFELFEAVAERDGAG
ncbi:hypothetical protein, partial [Rhodoplanes elegans]|uniref:hypothetical protein n=1 Tax=Rhodoplanes elegans TaxID=29408 RepID=UPI001A926411